MQALEPHAETIALAVRITARVSASLFALYLLAAGRADASRQPLRWRLFVAFVAAHTVHFSMVLLLAGATDGRNIEERMGWGVNVGVFALFYVAVTWIGHVQRQGAGPRGRAAAEVALAVIWLGFLQAYALRALDTPGFALLGGVLAVGYAIHTLDRRRAGRG